MRFSISSAFSLKKYDETFQIIFQTQCLSEWKSAQLSVEMQSLMLKCLAAEEEKKCLTFNLKRYLPLKFILSLLAFMISIWWCLVNIGVKWQIVSCFIDYSRWKNSKTTWTLGVKLEKLQMHPLWFVKLWSKGFRKSRNFTILIFLPVLARRNCNDPLFRTKVLLGIHNGSWNLYPLEKT